MLKELGQILPNYEWNKNTLILMDEDSPRPLIRGGSRASTVYQKHSPRKNLRCNLPSDSKIFTIKKFQIELKGRGNLDRDNVA